MKKWPICSWKHKDHRCYPEVWDRGLDGPWHCTKCQPCGKWLTFIRAEIEAEDRRIHRLWAQSLENIPF